MKNNIYLNNNFEKTDYLVENGFEVDEKIADTIILLNQKGYKTTYCCAGHYVEDPSYISSQPKTILSKEKLIESLNRTSKKLNQKIEFLKEENDKYYWKSTKYSGSCYVSFEENIILPSCPVGFIKHEENQNVIIYLIPYFYKRDITNKLDRKKVEQQIELANNNLKKWAEKLPVI